MMTMMRTLFLTMGLGLALSGFAAPPVQAAGTVDANDISVLFGKEPGEGEALACFRRVYTKAHLATHPDQNVTEMRLFVSKPEGNVSQFELVLGVNFRASKALFKVSGGCRRPDDGTGALSCGIECDGGWVGVRARDANAVLVDIPYSARLSDEAGDSDAVPQSVRFGSDDKIFRLERTALKDCLPLVWDEALKARLSKQ